MSVTGKPFDVNSAEDQIVGQGVHFERIRRITGYLVGDMRRWNNAKKAEEHDRVAHIDMGMQAWK